ncbi:MAG: secretin N-terminal domain-containing protein [Arhodomonas sp.]|nr:secretin N-terminal domain-containing protein [Arhodomonas sp.]
MKAATAVLMVALRGTVVTRVARASTPPSGAATIRRFGEVKVIGDDANNALLIMASPPDYETIKSAIRKLDIPPLQVLVDATDRRGEPGRRAALLGWAAVVLPRTRRAVSTARAL